MEPTNQKAKRNKRKSNTMKYFYDPPDEWTMYSAYTYRCNHPMYDACTLYSKDGKGVAVVQQRWSKKTKMTWWSQIDPWLVDDISTKPDWKD